VLSIAGVVAALVTSAAHAQSHIAWSKIEPGPWALNAVYTTNPVPGTTEVRNIVAVAKAVQLEGDNLVAVWYKKTGSAWETKSWTTGDVWEAIEHVKGGLGIADSEDERWETFGIPPSGGTGQAGSGYAGGVMSGDPLAELVDLSPDRDAIIELLTQAGYPAADIPIDKDDGCTPSEKLDWLANEFVQMVADGDETWASVSAVPCAAGPNNPIGPAPTKPVRPITAPPWTPPGTVPTAPTWIPGGWPTGPAWSCTATIGPAGSNTCTCVRIPQWGQWQCKPRWFGGCKIVWRLIHETETCSDVKVLACPTGGPPAALAHCTLSYP